MASPPPPPPPFFAFDAARDGVEVRAHPLKGRCLVAARPFSPGDVVLRQRPYAAALGGGDSTNACCDYCHRPCGLSSSSAAALSAPPAAAAAALPPALRCSGCKRARYCSPAHQRAAWAAWHREECAALADAAPRYPPLTLRLAARALWRRRRERQQGQQQQQQQGQQQPQQAFSSGWRDGGTWQEVEALRDGWADAGTGPPSNDGGSAQDGDEPGGQLPVPPARKLLLAQMATLLVRYYGAGLVAGGRRGPNDGGPNASATDGGSGGKVEPPSDVSVKEAALLLSRLALNAHALAGGGGWGCGAAGDGGAIGGAAGAGRDGQYGAALAPRAALLNHSPAPNVLQRFSRGGSSGGGTSGGGGAGGEACFVALRPVRPGEELTVAYVDVAGGAGARASSPLAARRLLREGYLFDPLPGGLAAGLPLRLPPVAASGAEEEEEGEGGGGEGRDDEVRVSALSGEAGRAAAAAAAADPRGAALTALAGGLGGGVDISLLAAPPSFSGGSAGQLQGELLALVAAAGAAGAAAAGGADWPAAGADVTTDEDGASSAVCVAVGWGPWADKHMASGAATSALRFLALRFLRAERLRARAQAASDAGSPRLAAGALAAALRLLEERDGGAEARGSPPLFLHLAPTQPLPLALRAALSDALFSAAVQEGRPRDEAAAWVEAREGALALERAAPPGWPALGLRLARAASLALRVAQDSAAEGPGGQGGLAASAATAAEGAALGERGLAILAATHGSGWGDEAAWVARNAAQALEELRHYAGGGRG